MSEFVFSSSMYSRSIVYNPFAKSLDEVKGSDFSNLTSVSEGWHIEYKSQIPNVDSIAKSISSFANQYGGWLFYGVQGSRDGNNFASNFPGVLSRDLQKVQQRIRDAAAHRISTPPEFEQFNLTGPVKEIGLEDGRAIVIVAIPAGSNPPYVHSSGRIYRRVADASEPVPETDRAALDLMWERSQRSHNRLTDFLEQDLELSEAEKDTSYLRLYMLTNVGGSTGIFSRLQLEEFADHMAKESESGTYILYDNIYSASGGFIARHVADNNPRHKVLTWRHNFDGSSVVDIPINSRMIGDPGISDRMSPYQYYEHFTEVCETTGLKLNDFIDLNILFFLLMAAFNTQKILMKSGGLDCPFYSKGRFINVWRKIPFLDTAGYKAQLETFGIPIIQESEIFAPSSTHRDSLLRNTSLEAKDLDGFGRMLGVTLQALGLAALTLDEGFIAEIMEAGQRGRIAHASWSSPPYSSGRQT